jgi:predicted RNA binding protein YcfA (HicA-like mRNA interferase family)
MAKDFKGIRKEAERQGWRVEVTKGGHWRFVPPDPTKPMVVTSSTPSDHRTLDNFIGRLRKSGFRWPPPR